MGIYRTSCIPAWVRMFQRNAFCACISLVLRFRDLSPIPKHLVQGDIFDPTFTRIVQGVHISPDISIIIERVPPIVATVANPVDIAALIVQCVFIGAMMAGLLLTSMAPDDWMLPSPAILFHGPFALRFSI